MSEQNRTDRAPALSMLSEEEEMFREAVRDFSESEIAPRATEMDRNEAFDADLITQHQIAWADDHARNSSTVMRCVGRTMVIWAGPLFRSPAWP